MNHHLTLLKFAVGFVAIATTLTLANSRPQVIVESPYRDLNAESELADALIDHALRTTPTYTPLIIREVPTYTPAVLPAILPSPTAPTPRLGIPPDYSGEQMYRGSGRAQGACLESVERDC